MNTTLTQSRSLDLDRRNLALAEHDSAARLSLIDRLSLRIGFALLLRSARRIDGRRDYDAHTRAIAHAAARDLRERSAAQEQFLRSIRA
ncbi:hypothetical protein [Microbacterium terricola]|uniref:Uncharacterized protein n=1 Tax=Microbacterium terricola TaxID=344163 RepID=A0ABM8DZ58_9MICO|nr:hypothetical protein [Microbacterium terricola]UYK41352.1 hypothetical protein OAU46_06900 [Microbacterium terricola]BDV30865.1 hypothetical protein Microterr_15250 [Microbacterium terricola]